MSIRAGSRESPRGPVAWGICWGLSALFALALSWLMRREIMPLPAPGALLLIDAVAVTLAAALLLSALPSEGRRSQLPLWAVLNALSAWLMLSRHGQPVPPMAPLAVGVLVLLAGGFKASLSRVFEPPVAHLCALAVLLVCGAAPLWLGPLVESFAGRAELANAVVAISPLSYLSVLLAADYLRYDWFYMNSVIGGLRYQYPSASAVTLSYASLATLFWWFGTGGCGHGRPKKIAPSEDG